MIKKLYYINIALFAVVVGMVALLFTERYPIPPEPQLQGSTETVTDTGPNPERGTEQSYAALGSAPIFDTIIPRPTPVPTPVPTQPPDPELDKAIAGWKFSGSLPGGTAMFEDKRTKEEWMMSLGEVRAVKYGKWTLDVKLESVDDNKFTATVSYTGDQGKQTKTLSLFE